MAQSALRLVRSTLQNARKPSYAASVFGKHQQRALSRVTTGGTGLHNHVVRSLLWNRSNKQCSYTTESTKKPASPEILSKLFPQTAASIDEETEKERKRKEEEEAKENEKAFKRMKVGFAVFAGAGGALVVWAVYEFGKPEVDPEGNIVEDEFSNSPAVQQYLQRMWKSMNYYQKMIQEPSRDKLLPDPLKPPYIQPPYTLVLEMKDVLVHPDWTYQTGWRFKKRPGVDVFLQECAKHFEIVVFTAEQGMTVFPILDALDPNGYIMYRLVRDATHFIDGHHVKNLDNLNRDLRKVIVIDWDANSTRMHPDNSFNLARWMGNDDDSQLFDLISFLKTIATSEVDDVRDVLHYYRQFDDPIMKFRENQQKLLEQMQERERVEQSKSKPIVIVIDWDANSTRMHPDNSFNLARWMGNDDDSQLFDLISFLKTIATSEVDDVRDVLHYYRQFDDPIMKFRENQQKLLEQMQERERVEQSKSKPIVKNWSRNFLGR